MSRSVMMPGPGWSGSMTTAAPTPRSAIALAASRSECPGLTVRTTPLIPSRTCIHTPLVRSCRSAQAYALIHFARHYVPWVMVGEAKRPATVERRRELFEDAAAIVRAEYPRDLALDDVARRVAASRRQLQRAFAEAGETTFRTYVQKVRMVRAAQLLRQNGAPVHRIALAVGYRQPAQFAKAFRRHHGAPPSAFRG